MSDQERHDMLERFIYMHQSTTWGVSSRATEKAHELARPILLEMVRKYADGALACLDGVCKHEPPLAAEASLHDDEEEPMLGPSLPTYHSQMARNINVQGEQLSREEWYYKGIEYGMEHASDADWPTQHQEQEALEESCKTYEVAYGPLLQEDWVNQMSRKLRKKQEREAALIDDRLQAVDIKIEAYKVALADVCNTYHAKQDRQFLEHKHAMKNALFIGIRDRLVSVIRENVGYTVEDHGGYRHLRAMTPDIGFSQLISAGVSTAIELGADDDYSTVLATVEAALESMFKEVHDV